MANPRVCLTLPDGKEIDATNLKVVIDGGPNPLTLGSMVWYYLEGKKAIEANEPDHEFDGLRENDEWDGWGDPPGEH